MLMFRSTHLRLMLEALEDQRAQMHERISAVLAGELALRCEISALRLKLAKAEADLSSARGRAAKAQRDAKGST